MHGIREGCITIRYRHRFLLLERNKEAENATGWRTFGQCPLLLNIQTSSGGLLMSAKCRKQTFVAIGPYATISRTTPPTMTAIAATSCGPMCSCLRNTKL